MSIEAIEKGQTFLKRSQNADGGWGYRVGDDSSVEATAIVTLAQALRVEREEGVNWFLRAQQDDGGWGMHQTDDASNWLTAWGVWAMLNAATRTTLAAARKGVNWLLTVPVAGMESKDTNNEEAVEQAVDSISQDLRGMNLKLLGWAWQPGGASWVEPTAMSILALTLTGEQNAPRVLEGTAYLQDRICIGGGWNVGAPINFGHPMGPTPHHTVVTLLALRAAKLAREGPVIADSLKVLQNHANP